MARIGNASTDRINIASGNAFSAQTGTGTVAFWAKPATAHAAYTGVLSVGGTASQSAYCTVSVNNTEGVEIGNRTSNSGTNNAVKGVGTMTLDVWNHGVVTTSGTAWGFYLNGVSQSTSVVAGSNTGDWFGDVSPTGPQTVLMNELYQNVYDADARNCDLAEIALWSVVLDAGEVTALAAGASPIMVRPQSLVAYWNLINDATDQLTYRSGQTITGTTVTAHPRVYVPSRTLTRIPVPIPVTPISSSDTISISVVESGTVATTDIILISGTDTIVSTASETSAVFISIALSADDTIVVSTEEASAIFATFSADDTLALGISEASVLYVVTPISDPDTLSIVLGEIVLDLSYNLDSDLDVIAEITTALDDDVYHNVILLTDSLNTYFPHTIEVLEEILDNQGMFHTVRLFREFGFHIITSQRQFPSILMVSTTPTVQDSFKISLKEFPVSIISRLSPVDTVAIHIDESASIAIV